MYFSKTIWGLAAAVSLVGAVPAFAGEAAFGYVYTTDVMPKGKFEVEQWLTDREGQAHGRFHDLQMRTEVEYGVTNNFQLAGYLNYSYLDANRNSTSGVTEGLDIPADHDPTRPYRRFRYDGVSAEAIWRVMSPYKDPIGLAFYVEPEVGPRENAVEVKILLQKNYLDDRLVLAANLWSELEREKVEGEGWHKAAVWELDLGASYRFRPNWSAGLEFRNHNEFQGWTLDHAKQEHTAYFIGPTIHYAGERWFVTATALYQLHAKAYSDDQREQIAHGRIYGDEHTTWDGLRLKIGRTFQ